MCEALLLNLKENLYGDVVETQSALWARVLDCINRIGSNCSAIARGRFVKS